MRPRFRPYPCRLAEDVKLLVDYRDQLVGERTRVANRVHADLTITTVELDAREAGVAARELLVRDLCCSVGIAAALAGINDLFAAVFIVDVATGHDDRVGPIVATGDPALGRTMDTGGGSLGA